MRGGETPLSSGPACLRSSLASFKLIPLWSEQGGPSDVNSEWHWPNSSYCPNPPPPPPPALCCWANRAHLNPDGAMGPARTS